MPVGWVSFLLQLKPETEGEGLMWCVGMFETLLRVLPPATLSSRKKSSTQTRQSLLLANACHNDAHSVSCP